MVLPVLPKTDFLRLLGRLADMSQFLADPLPTPGASLTSRLCVRLGLLGIVKGRKAGTENLLGHPVGIRESAGGSQLTRES